jgi:PPP family 3-phenylpropionic acid transporter
MRFANKEVLPIRRDLWMARWVYFTFMGGWGFLFPFLNLYYVSLGLRGTQIGMIASTASIVGLISAPVWASQVKRFTNPRIFLQAALLCSATAYLLIGHQDAFLPILLFAGLQSVSGAGILPLTDSMAVTVSREAGTGYGSVRMWGSLGWIAAVPLSGWLMERLGFRAGFWGIFLALLLSAALLFLIDPKQFTDHQPAGEKPQGGMRLAVRRVLEDRTLLGFALALIFVGFLNNGVLQFENVFLSKMGATKQLISFAGILSAIVELPFMLFADRIIQRYGAHRLMFSALFFNIFLRLTVLSFPAIVTIMVVRFIGGISFSLYTVSFVGLISERTSPGERGTVLVLYTVTIAGVVSIVAAPIFGAIFDAIGARWLYSFSAAGYLAAALSMWLTRPRRVAAPLLG